MILGAFARAARVVCFVLAACSLVAACAAVDSSLSSRLLSYNGELNQFRNDEILLNILRSREFEPLTFAPASEIGGQLSSTTNLGLPSFAVGHDAASQFAFSNATLGTTTAVNTSTKAAPLVTSQFYDRLLSPITPSNFLGLLQQGYSRELLFWILPESVRVRHSDGRDELFMNQPPFNTACELGRREPSCFEEFVHLAMQWGLTAVPIAPARGKKDAAPSAALCFDELLGSYARRAAQRSGHRDWGSSGSNVRCETGRAAEANKLAISRGGTRYEITPRSPMAIYRFLGSVLEGGPGVAILIDERGGHPGLLTVVRAEGGGCFAKANYRGVEYCVPESGTINTKQVFAVLSQLTAQSTSRHDLQIGSAIILAP
ncbi:hypothetical protein ACUN0C_17080 [Faunimonas sp. B44]|uniref:hypothetical protein n=1 Tax=Faunimonas sp. B44 TaxID=3461493 RepID=UPI004043F795